MAEHLQISLGQYSDRGRKETNQDFHGAFIPREGQLISKGIAIALADGISSSDVSQVASQFAVAAFLEDYYCTSDAWSVKTAIERVLAATNAWLYAQTRQSAYRYDQDRGYVCTLSGMVLKSTTAHIFHVGDTRIYQLRGTRLEQLTDDHRVWVSPGKSYLGRAIGINARLEIDYRSLPLEKGDAFILATDGVYEHVPPKFIIDTVWAEQGDLDQAARRIVEEAYRQGSADNLSIQVVRVDALPEPGANELYRQLAGLPFPPPLDARMDFDGYRIVRQLHASSRSHVYLGVDPESGAQLVIKAPSVALRDDPAYLERFLMEEWIARRIDSAHVLKPCQRQRQRNYLYVATEFVEGQTLAQWMIDNPRSPLQTVRGIVEQIAKGLRAFHRMEMLHQDLRPENVMIDRAGTVKIIDFGSTVVAGVEEITGGSEHSRLLGTAQYTAPEYFLGELGTARSDLFSLGVIAYQMLCGKLPYGTEVAKSRTVAAQRKLQYRPLRELRRDIPGWVDEAIRKAVHPEPAKRYQELSEFVFDLSRPNAQFLRKSRAPLVERDPVLFWKVLSVALILIIVLQLGATTLSGPR